jgi:hypothetical protein
MTQYDKQLSSLRSSHDRIAAAIRRLDGCTDPTSRTTRTKLEEAARRIEAEVRDTCAMAS